MSERGKEFVDIEDALVAHLVRMETLIERSSRFIGLMSSALAEANGHLSRIATAAEALAETSMETAPTKPKHLSEQDTVIPR